MPFQNVTSQTNIVNGKELIRVSVNGHFHWCPQRMAQGGHQSDTAVPHLVMAPGTFPFIHVPGCVPGTAPTWFLICFQYTAVSETLSKPRGSEYKNTVGQWINGDFPWLKILVIFVSYDVHILMSMDSLANFDFVIMSEVHYELKKN